MSHLTNSLRPLHCTSAAPASARRAVRSAASTTTTTAGTTTPIGARDVHLGFGGRQGHARLEPRLELEEENFIGRPLGVSRPSEESHPLRTRRCRAMERAVVDQRQVVGMALDRAADAVPVHRPDA